jgi:hypothetical protein|tara:strand:- start:4844 stop:5005 length:162 start_codon:yes stop_codon:yes gene_type:complete
MDGEVTGEEALQMHGGKFTYCKACVQMYEGAGSRTWRRNEILCESCSYEEITA